MTEFDPYAYRITVQKIEIEGVTYFSGSIRELPDAEVFEESPQEAYEGMAKLVLDLKAAADEEKRAFPLPVKDNANVSGRVTLRLPKWLHARLDQQALSQEISLNAHLSTLLADASARVDAPAPFARIKEVTAKHEFSVVNLVAPALIADRDYPVLVSRSGSITGSRFVARKNTTSVIEESNPSFGYRGGAHG